MTPDEAYLENLQVNLKRLQEKQPRVLDGSGEATRIKVHIAGLDKEIAKVQARIKAAADTANAAPESADSKATA